MCLLSSLVWNHCSILRNLCQFTIFKNRCHTAKHTLKLLKEAAIVQPHLSHYRLSSGPLNSVIFVESCLPPRKLGLSKNHWTSMSCYFLKFGFGIYLLSSSLQKKPFPRNISWVAAFRGKMSHSNANPTAMQVNDLCNNSVPACKNINNTQNVCHKFTNAHLLAFENASSEKQIL